MTRAERIAEIAAMHRRRLITLRDMDLASRISMRQLDTIRALEAGLAGDEGGEGTDTEGTTP